MSEPVRIALVGATGLIGRTILNVAVGQPDVKVTAIGRREMKLPEGGQMEMIIADPENWGEVLDIVQPTVLVNALGTTWKQSGRNEEVFRAVDQHLVLQTARAAIKAGAERMISLSSVGASPGAKTLYLKVKGEVERDLAKLGFKRLDIFRPGLLKGTRQQDFRFAEGLAKLASPLLDPLLGGGMRRYRSIDATLVAEGVLAQSLRKAAGRFFHDNDGIARAARDWNKRKV